MRLNSKRSAVFLVVMTLLIAACGDGGTSDTTAAPDEGASTTAPAATEAPATTAAPSEAAVTLTFLVDDTQNTIDTATALADAFTAQNPDVAFEIETRPGGGEGDNIVKTRLATGEMTDIFWYNSGSLFQALNPTESLVPITDQAYVENIVDAFLPTVTANGDVYGVPAGTALGGGVLYNKAIYEELGLSVPTSWEEFAANNQAILDAGSAAPVGQTYMAPDTWTSQLFILADYYNVQVQDPDWAEKYTNNQAKYVDQPALSGFQRLQEGFESGWYQEGFGSATFDDGLNMLATGEIVHYPMLSFALSTIAENHPDAIQDIGYFGQPGDDAATNGSTIWMPAGIYIAGTSENQDVAKEFLGFVASIEGTDAQTAAVAPQGPYMIDGSSLPADTLPAVLDIQAYIDGGNVSPALEFLSPIKGPNLEFLTVEVGSGLTTAEEAAALYDEDVIAQAQQLGLPGW
ncbi:MAG: extracellular solute-binding protein [Acidimicrobiia bacterium]|jgi:raffinose/stachyose/melibiose transport system substrate-binding protein